MRPVRVPEHVESTLPNGLRVLAVQRHGEPLAEIRLRIPFAGADPAPARLLARTLFSGSTSGSAARTAAAVRDLGATLGVEVDQDRLRISGRAPVGALDRLLATVAQALEAAAYPPSEVATARAALADRLRTDRCEPARLAGAALAARIYPGHPYRLDAPEPEEVASVQAGELRALHARLVRPAGSTLVVVGDLDPQAVVAVAARQLAGWTGAVSEYALPPVPPLRPGALLLVDRPGSTRSSLRMAFPAVPRGHPDNPALRLANLVFGGYFCSRWTANLREDKGYTYGPSSVIQDRRAGARLIASAEVAAEHAAAALGETLYELARMACLPPGQAELDRARGYTLGALVVLGMSTHRDLADLAAGLVDGGLPLTYLAGYADRLAAATVEEVHEAARRYLAPSGAVTVLLADAQRVGHAVAALTPVTVRRG